MFMFGTNSYGFGDEVCSLDDLTFCDCYCVKLKPIWTDGEGTCYMENSNTFDLFSFLQLTPSNHANLCNSKKLHFKLYFLQYLTKCKLIPFLAFLI